MVTITLHCPRCGSDALVRDEHAPMASRSFAVTPAGAAAARTRLPTPRLQARREEIVHAYQERSSLRGLTRTFGVSRATVSSWIKKRSSASSLIPRDAHHLVAHLVGYTRDLVKQGYVGKIRSARMSVSVDGFQATRPGRIAWTFDASNFSHVLSIYAGHFMDMLFQSVGFPPGFSDGINGSRISHTSSLMSLGYSRLLMIYLSQRQNFLLLVPALFLFSSLSYFS